MQNFTRLRVGTKFLTLCPQQGLQRWQPGGEDGKKEELDEDMEDEIGEEVEGGMEEEIEDEKEEMEE